MSGPQQSINPFENFAPGGPPSQAPAPSYAPAAAAPASGFGWGAALTGAWAPAAPQPVPTQEPDSPPPSRAGPAYTLEAREAPPIWSQQQGQMSGRMGPPQGPQGWGSTALQPEPSAASSATLLQPSVHTASDATVPAITGTAAAGAAGAGQAKTSWFRFSGKPADGNGGPPDLPGNDTRPLLNNGQAGASAAAAPQRLEEDSSKYAFYNVRRYRPYFNVDTREVLWRVLSSFIGVVKADFIEVTLEKPDLYGPFWIATTLIFITAAAGNLYSYIYYKKVMNTSPPPPPPSNSTDPVPSSSGSLPDVVTNQWFADPTKLSASAGIFYGYVFILSILLWLWIKYMRGDIKLVNVFCMYGYAMTIFIPVAVLCIIPNTIVQWVLIMTATAISGGFLVRNLRIATIEVALIKTIWLLGVVLALQVGLGLALKLYFFHY